MPQRIQLSRRKGWRMPPHTVKVDRTTKWGNPFIVGEDGTRARCIELFRLLIGGGLLCISAGEACLSRQRTLLLNIPDARAALAFHNLACWCPLSAPCHADVWLEFINGAVRVPPVERIG